MAGHSKWANIQHRKKAQDAKRGKLFTKLIREVTVAVKHGGPDAASNARLRLWQGVWWEMVVATGAIFFIVLAFNLLGDALRDALDPRLRTEESPL